jgi:para-nitrobenzyl esterase
LMDVANTLRFGPVVDGAILPAHPFDPVATSISADVPVIVGYTRTERTVYEVDSPAYGTLDQTGLLANVRTALGDGAESARARAVIDSYRKRSPKATPYELSIDITNDVSAMSSIRLAERRAALGKAPTFMYVWAWETPVMNLRAPHTLEIPFVFNHIEDCPTMVGPVNARMRGLESATAGAWAALARSGSPSHTGLPAWPAYEPKQRNVMMLDSPSRVERDPTGEVRRIMERRPEATTTA